MNYIEIHLQVGDVGLAGAVEGGGGEDEERGVQAEAQPLPSR